MFSDTNSVMYFSIIYCVIFAVSLLILTAINRNATSLRKSWNVYVVMLILNGFFFLGLMFFLPYTRQSIGKEFDYNKEIERVENLQDMKSILREQRREINELRDSAHTFRNIFWVFILMSVMFFPTIYYNLIKSNLEIEKLSGKRLGSLD